MSQAKPANVVGPTVRGTDLWGRRTEIAALWKQLAKGSVLLTAPRRYGKSSVMCALADAPQDGWQVVHLDVEYVESPKDFLVELTASLLQLHKFRALLKKVSDGAGALVGWVKNLVGDVTVGIGETKLSLRASLKEGISWEDLTEQLISLLQDLDERLLVILDEFPMMIANFLDGDEKVAITFLQWFRGQRQRSQTARVSFLLGGSVNIEPRLEYLRQEASINDLDRFHLEPLQTSEAIDFVRAVLDAEQAQVHEELPREIVRVADCGIHFFLQVLIAECLAEQRRRQSLLKVADVESLYTSRVLGPPNRARFSHYRSRLKEYYGPLERAAHLILDVLAANRELTVSKIKKILQANDEAEVKPDELLSLLESDYYILRDGEIITFSNGFLRNWWLRNATSGRDRS